MKNKIRVQVQHFLCSFDQFMTTEFMPGWEYAKKNQSFKERPKGDLENSCCTVKNNRLKAEAKAFNLFKFVTSPTGTLLLL